MQIKTVLLTVGLVIASSSGLTAKAASAKSEIVPPVPLVMTAPVRLPWEYERATVKLELVVDEHGRPCHVDVAELVPTELRELVIAAVEKWKFQPATRNGVPVRVRVVLPLNLVTH